MKRGVFTTTLSLGSLLLVACSSSINTPSTVVAKDFDVYEGAEVVSSLKGYFLDDIDAPYINIRDLASCRMGEPFATGFPIPDYSYSYNGGVLECKNTYGGESYSLYIDGNKDEIRSDFFEESIDIFHYGMPMDLLAADRSVIAKPVNVPKSVQNKVTLSLGDYHLDLVTNKDTVLIPFALANALFFCVGEKCFNFNGRAFFETSSTNNDNVKDKYFCYTTSEKSTPINEDSALFNRNLTFFMLNSFFGRKDETFFTDFRDFANTLGIYDDMASVDPLTSFKALGNLIEGIDDLHSACRSPSPKNGYIYGEDEKDKATKQAYYQVKTKGQGYRMANYFLSMENFLQARIESLGQKDDYTEFHFYGDTCIIRFDGFKRMANDSVFLKDGTIAKQGYSTNSFNLFYDAFAEIKKHPEIKKIAIDESINGGGDATTLIEIAGFFMKEVHINIKNKVGGTVRSLTYKVDTNYDGKYTEDDYPGVNYDVYCLTSPCSFSCGNIFPLIFRDNKAATIVGEASGGGSCAVLPLFSAEGDYFQISGPYELGSVTSSGAFVSSDSGIRPSIYANPTAFYDDATLVATLE
jgi:hypothetical protein